MGYFEVLAEIRAEERNEIFVQNMLRKGTFTDDEIAELADVTLEFIQEVKEDIASGNSHED